MTTKKKVQQKKEKICFVIGPIGEEGTQTRRRADLVLKHIISPPVTECGYKPIRADRISEIGIITTQIIQHIAGDPMVVADLTERNPNVFYELALRHALQLPVIQIMDKAQKRPFDVAAMRTIPFDHTDLESVEKTKKEIVKQIRASEKPDFKSQTPISVAVKLQSLLKSDAPEDKRLGDALSSLEEIQNAVVESRRILSRPRELLPPDYLRSLLEPSHPAAILLEEIQTISEDLRDIVNDKNCPRQLHAKLTRTLSLLSYLERLVPR